MYISLHHGKRIAGLAFRLIVITAITSVAFAASPGAIKVKTSPPAPKPEPVSISELPLPPTAPSSAEGSCSTAVNPRGTGCIASYDNGIFEGPSYMWDGQHVLMPVEFEGAPAGSIYQGHQVLAIKTDGTLFPNGDAWKCLTCGVPVESAKGVNRTGGAGAGYIASGGGRGMPGAGGGGRGTPGVGRAGGGAGANIMMDHPHAFHDGRRIIAGTNVVECGQYKLTDAACTPDRVHIYPMFWQMKADGSGPNGPMRELRLDPDDVHLGWNAMGINGETGVMGTLVFNPAPKTGPQVPRYDLEKVTLFTSPKPEFSYSFYVDPKNPGYLLKGTHGKVGEWRGWSSDGNSIMGMGLAESMNTDIYMTSLATGESTRMTSDPAYTDPMKMSPDDKWFVAMDNRAYPERHMWYAGMQGVAPLTDMLGGMLANMAWRNANRRFFQPILIDRYGDRGDYHGQQLNAGPGTPGSPSDPNWNGRADPAWSPDGTAVVYWQALVTAPACGGANQMACPESTEPGGRRTRLMIAHLTSRKPLPVRPIKPTSDVVPWAFAYHPGDKIPAWLQVPAGKYILKGKVSGRADVEIRTSGEHNAISFISATYTDYSDDGLHIINGTEGAERVGSGVDFMSSQAVLRYNLKLSGVQTGTKVTGEGGFKLGGMGRSWQGTLTTTIDGKVYTTPPPGT